MNIRFSEGAIRCRVARPELDQLLGSGGLRLAVPLPRHHSLQVTVRCMALDEWQLDSDPTGLWIGIPRAQLQALAQALPSREGITHEFDVGSGTMLQLSFEVDVRKPRREKVTAVEEK